MSLDLIVCVDWKEIRTRLSPTDDVWLKSSGFEELDSICISETVSVISGPPVYTLHIYSNCMNVKYTFFDCLSRTMQCLDMPYKCCSIRNANQHSRRMRTHAPWESVTGQATAYQKTQIVCSTHHGDNASDCVLLEFIHSFCTLS
jgi:hypothetical protein